MKERRKREERETEDIVLVIFQKVTGFELGDNANYGPFMNEL